MQPAVPQAVLREGADDGVRQQLPEGVHLGSEQRGQGDVHGEGEARGRRERVHGHVAEVEQGRPEELAEGSAVLVHLGGEPVQLRRHAGLGQVQLLEGRLARLEEVPRAVQVARLEAELPEVRPQEQAGAAGGGGGQAGFERPALPGEEGLSLRVCAHARRRRHRHLGQPQRAHLVGGGRKHVPVQRDEDMAKTESKKSDLDDTMASLTSKIDKAAAKSASLKNAVKEAQEVLAGVAKSQAEMDKLRQEQNADYKQAKADLELGLGGVQKALEKLREYYGGAAALAQTETSFGAFMQQPDPPAKHQKSSGAGQSIIGILEVCESDFSKNLAAEESEEADSVEEYDSQSQENKITKSTKEQDVKYKTQEFKSLDKEITELTSDKETTGTELSAVNEYYGKLKERCVAKPETYEERKKRREEEIAGLKEALQTLEEETAFVQRKRRSFRGALSTDA